MADVWCPGMAFDRSNWRNWLVLSVLVIENIQFNALLFQPHVPWFNNTHHLHSYNATICASSMATANVSTAGNRTGQAGTTDQNAGSFVQQFMEALVLFRSEDVSWALSLCAVALYGLLIGLFIEQEKTVCDPLAPILFEFLSGTM